VTVAEFVERERAQLRRTHLVTAVALVLAATTAVVALGVLVLGGSRWLALPRAAPFAVWLVLAAVNAFVARWAWRRLVLAAARDRVAAEIEREQALRAGALRGVLEAATSGALGRYAASGMAARLRSGGPRLAPGLQRAASRRALRMLAAALVAGVLLGGVAPVYGDGLMAILRPIRAWRGTLLPPIEFADLPAAIVRGESLRLRVRAPRRTAIVVHGRATGEGWRAMPLPIGAASGEAVADFGAVRGDLTIVATDGRSATDTVVVRVVDRPFVGAVSIRAVYPAYLRRDPEGLPAGEPARVPQGTTIVVAGRASTVLTDVRLVGPSGEIPLPADGRAFEGRFQARATGTWTWLARGAGGPIADVPLPIELQVVADSAPRVQLVAPASDTAVAASDQVVLRVSASDDHGLAVVALHARRRAASERATRAARPAPPGVQRIPAPQVPIWDGAVTVDLASWGLEPGDALALRIVATDNSPWAQTGASRELVLTVPTMEERRAMARGAGDSAVRDARSAAEAQRSLARRTEEAARERGQRGQSRSSNESAAAMPRAGETPAMSYEQSEHARSIAKDQQAVAERMEALRKSAAALEQQLRQAGALDSSLARQLRDVQQLLREALTPELMEQMRKLEEAAQRLSGNDAREAMRDLAAMQQRLREQLEKSAEMLKRAAYEGAMQTLRDEAKELAKKERAFADSAAKGADPRSQSEDARRLSERSERFKDNVETLQERLARDRADAAAKNTDAARRHAEAGEERMREAAQAAQREAQRAERADAEKARGADQKSSAQDRRADRQGQRAGEAPSQRTGQRAERSQEQPAAGQSQDRQGAGEQRAREAAGQMDNAAQAMQDARDAQVQEWKKELTSELDQSVQELLQMARQESALEQQARSGRTSQEQMRGRQSSVQQGLDQAGKRLQEAGKKSALLSGRSQRAMADAKQKVGEATRQLSGREGDGRSPGSQAASALGEAADALNRAAASLARDRERANGASSASGFAEMLQQMQEMAKRQGAINSQAQGLLSMPGGQGSPGAQATAQALARQQRSVAQQLDELGDAPGANRAAELAREARRLAEALEGGRLDAATLARQEQLFRRLLDAGRSLEKDEREDSDRREAKAAVGAEGFTPENINATGRAGTRFREPTWDELRGLTADERRAILEYFKRINVERP
jgi:hypothetical protein